MMEPLWRKKQKEYEQKKARAKALKLRLSCTICGSKALLNCPCGTTQYCSTECQRIDWRDRGHRKACKKIRNERAAEAARAEAEAARAEAPTPPPSPPRAVVYGPAPRSYADEVRARIAAEHEAARARREANPEPPQPYGAEWGSRCPVCYEDWDVNHPPSFQPCCAGGICPSCVFKHGWKPCPLCRTPPQDPTNTADFARNYVAQIRRHVENGSPRAMTHLGDWYRDGGFPLVKSVKKAARLYERAVELGFAEAMVNLGCLYDGRLQLDRKKEKQLYQAAADLGNAHGQHNLGKVLQEEGEDEAAITYFRAAALQGLIRSMWTLAICYKSGRGTEVRIDESMCWSARAAVKGHEEAISLFKTLSLDSETVERLARIPVENLQLATEAAASAAAAAAATGTILPFPKITSLRH